MKIETPSCSTGTCQRATFHSAAVLVEGFALPAAAALPILVRWAERGDHRWKPKELEAKVADAAKRAKDVGYLLRTSRPSKAGVR